MANEMNTIIIIVFFFQELLATSPETLVCLMALKTKTKDEAQDKG